MLVVSGAVRPSNAVVLITINKMKVREAIWALISFRVASAQDKIVGGTQAEKGRYPFQAALVYSEYYSTGVYCGGTLIAKNWVLSAAHCYSGDNLYVQLGRYDFNDANEEVETIPVAWQTKHPGYNDENLDNDFMLIKLSKESTHEPIPLLDNGFIDTGSGTRVTTMGWGTTSSGGAASPVLLEVELGIVSNEDCNADDAYSGAVSENMMCAAESEKDSCQGDSGGPLIFNDPDGDVLVGVVSWGVGCADPSYPSVYARVAKRIEWIQNEMSTGTDPGDDQTVSEDDDLYQDEQTWDDDWWSSQDDFFNWDDDWFNNDIFQDDDDEEEVTPNDIFSQLLQLISLILDFFINLFGDSAASNDDV